MKSKMKKSFFRKKLRIKPGEHLPNKKESESIRKAMSETGKTESELREEKYYRKLFSSAAKVKVKTQSQKIDDDYKNLCKLVRKKTGFSNRHPESLVFLTDYLLKNQIKNPLNLSVKEIVRRYGS